MVCFDDLREREWDPVYRSHSVWVSFVFSTYYLILFFLKRFFLFFCSTSISSSISFIEALRGLLVCSCVMMRKSEITL